MIELRLQLVIDLDRADQYADSHGIRPDPVALVRDEIVSLLLDQRFVLDIKTAEIRRDAEVQKLPRPGFTLQLDSGGAKNDPGDRFGEPGRGAPF